MTLRCALNTYVTAGVDEYGDFWFEAECDGGPTGDCGWRIDIKDFTVDSAGFRELEHLHAEHSAATGAHAERTEEKGS